MRTWKSTRPSLWASTIRGVTSIGTCPPKSDWEIGGLTVIVASAGWRVRSKFVPVRLGSYNC
jgi:hypothetical protein